MIRLLEITLELERLKGVFATERNAKVIGQRIDLEAEKSRLIYQMRRNAKFLQVSHRPRF
jgi:hypothetical protein